MTKTKEQMKWEYDSMLNVQAVHLNAANARIAELEAEVAKWMSIAEHVNETSNRQLDYLANPQLVADILRRL